MYLQNYLQKALGKTNPTQNEPQKSSNPQPNFNMPQTSDSIMKSADQIDEMI